MTLNYTKAIETLYGCKGDFKEQEIRINYALSTETVVGTSLMKIFLMKLTKDEDPLFLRLMRMNEQDFNELKTQQRLRVKFDDFPSYVVSLLDASLKGLKSTSAVTSDIDSESKCLHLTDDLKTSKLEIVASNKSQTWVYLSLTFDHASEKELQKYLCDSLLRIKKEYTDTESQRQAQLFDLQRKLSDTENKYREREKAFRAKEEKFASTLKMIKTDFDKEKRGFLDEIKVLKDECTSFLNNAHHEQELHTGLVEEKEKLKIQLEESNKEIQSLETQLRSLELNFDEKECDYKTLVEKFDGLVEEQTRLHEYCEQVEERLTRSETAYLAQTKETEKGIEIIRKFQADLVKKEKLLTLASNRSQSYKSELAQCNIKLSETEKAAEKALLDCKQMASDVLAAQTELAKLKEQNTQLTVRMSSVEKELADCKKQLETKELEAKFFRDRLEDFASKAPLVQTTRVNRTESAPKNYLPVLGQHRRMPLFDKENVNT